MKEIWLLIRIVLNVVGVLITLPFVHMAGPEATGYWSMNVMRIMKGLEVELKEMMDKD